MYYCQSRYYDPTIGRFLNADAFASSGQGLLGNNMFAYCLNNPVNLFDPRGTIPFYDDPFTKAIDDFIHWYNETDENETDDNGKPTLSSKAKKTINSIIRNLEFSAGVGVGLGQIINIFNLGESISANYDIIAMQYLDSEWSWGQRIAMSLSVSATQAFEFGGGLDAFRKFSGEVDSNSWIIFNNTKESWTLFSFAYYPWFLGCNVYLGFDLNSFLFEVTPIWEE